MLTRRRVAAAAVLLSTALAGTPALVSSAQAAPDRSDRAVARAAVKYGVSESALEARLRDDPTLRLAPSGLAYFVDPAAEGKAPPARVTAQSFPLNQTFLLHSKSNSNKTIYLDFNGHNVSGTLWNGSAGNNLPAGTQPAMDLAGNGAAFSDAELLQIQDIFLRVAEDYAPFDVDVTTEEPPLADLDRSNSGDQIFGTRAVITSNSSAFQVICGGNCGGIAFIDVFSHYSGKDNFVETHEQLQPAFVFPQGLSNDPKNIAEATSHEVGHNLGLDHDGCAPNGGSCPAPGGYYTGHDMWAPIMGVGYNKPVAQFALSDYPGADLGGPTASLQPNANDIETIEGSGAVERADEAGATVGAAGPLPAGTAYISDRTDVDVIALGTCSGNVSVNASNADVAPNLDIDLQLLNAGSTQIDQDNPNSAYVNRDSASGLDASVSGSSLPAGQYYARVDGIGRGTALTSYTDYGSLGAYTLQVTGCGGVDPGEEVPSKPQNLDGSYDSESNTVLLGWSAPADDGGAAIIGYNVYEDGVLLNGDQGPINALGATIGQISPGTHTYGVTAVNSVGEGPAAEIDVNATSTPTAKPKAPKIGTATPGKKGGKLTAGISWKPPSGTTNPAIDGYRVIAYRQNNKGKYVKVSTSPTQGASIRSIEFETNSRAQVKFAVQAHNGVGWGPLSAKSNAVRPR